MSDHLFIAGVPATGKSWLGNWLAATHGYLHIDAEREDGADFDRLGIHDQWNHLIGYGRASDFVTAMNAIGSPVVVNWGFPPQYLYVVTALQNEGVQTWWLHGGRVEARQAFVARGGIDVKFYDNQVIAIERHWSLIERVFNGRIVSGLDSTGAQREPGEIWRAIRTTPN